MYEISIECLLVHDVMIVRYLIKFLLLFCQGLYLDYNITMTNDLQDDVFFKHYSADEFCKYVYVVSSMQ